MQRRATRANWNRKKPLFFGSLDGASKFVKGDAVAGLLITFLNFVVGLAIGTMVHGMPLKTAFETYAILTVGDGLVTQIPAVIISIASALLLSKGGAIGSADKAVLKQLGNYPQALGTVAFLMALFAVVPGLPFAPFLFASILFGSTAFVMSRRKSLAKVNATLIDATTTRQILPKIGDLLDVDEIHVQFSKDLVPTVLDESFGLENRILNMRNHIAKTFGLIVPEIRLTDSPMLESGTYKIVIQGVDHAKSQIYPDKTLVLLNNNLTTSVPGVDVTEPVYGAPARWISSTLQETAVLEGLTVVSPIEVVATHLLETLKQNFGRIFTRRALRKLLDEIVMLSDNRRGESNRRLIEEFIPEKVPIDVLHSVLKSLLDERVSIRNLQLILEAISEVHGAIRNTDLIAEHVRQRLGFQIVNEFQEPNGTLPLIQISPEWEKTFEAFASEAVNGTSDIALPPDEINRLTLAIAEGIKKGSDSGKYPAIVTSARRRKFVQTIIAAKGIRNPVFSYDEIGTRSRPFIVGSV